MKMFEIAFDPLKDECAEFDCEIAFFNIADDSWVRVERGEQHSPECWKVKNEPVILTSIVSDALKKISGSYKYLYVFDYPCKKGDKEFCILLSAELCLENTTSGKSKPISWLS